MNRGQQQRVMASQQAKLTALKETKAVFDQLDTVAREPEAPLLWVLARDKVQLLVAGPWVRVV